MEQRFIEDTQFCEIASDNTDYTLAHVDGLYCLTNSKGQVICEFIRQQPTIDPVHAAGACYCRECEYRKLTYGASEVKGYLCASKTSPCRNRIVSPVDFCCYGEREPGKE